jgi:uncharacterized protein (DUF1810 family)
MTDKFNLNRFLEAQSSSYNIALFEIKNGRKSSHWMWYIFPQIYGLGNSTTSKMYAIKSEEEARYYLNHPILGKRLIEITEEILFIKNKTAIDILGSPDDLKLKSSMTLFHSIQAENKLFWSVLEKYFDGSQCNRTLSAINQRN